MLVLVSEVDAQNGETARRIQFYFKTKGLTLIFNLNCRVKAKKPKGQVVNT